MASAARLAHAGLAAATFVFGASMAIVASGSISRPRLPEHPRSFRLEAAHEVRATASVNPIGARVLIA